MTFKQLQKTLFTKKDSAIMQVENFSIPCNIHDVRSVYGRTDFLVSPKNGSGEKWISEERIKF